MGEVSDQLKELQNEVDKWKEVADKWHEEAVGNFNSASDWEAKAEARKLSRDAEIQMRKNLQRQYDDLKLDHGKLRTNFDKDGRALTRLLHHATKLFRDLTEARETIDGLLMPPPIGRDHFEDAVKEAKDSLARRDAIDRGWDYRGGVGDRVDDAPILQQFDAMMTVLKEAVALADQADAFDLDWRHECLNLALRAHLALNHESLTWTKEEIDAINKEAEELGKMLNWNEDKEHEEQGTNDEDAHPGPDGG